MKNSEQDNVTSLTESTINRRAFVKAAGFTGLGLAGAALVAGKLGVMDKVPGASALGFKPTSVESAGITDVDILNFALNHESLEAEFYTMAFYGKRISDFGIGETGTGDYGPTTGGQKVNFANTYLMRGSASLGAVAEEITADEQEHVRLLRSALGSAAVAKPAINLDALGIGFADYQQFVQLSRAFEDTGVSAYGGAAPLIASKAYLGVAVQIGLLEAYHASVVRLVCAGLNLPTFALDSLDFPPPPTGKQYFDDKNGLTVVRTPGEVLAIVYHNSASGTRKGGFFPYGVNGNINTV